MLSLKKKKLKTAKKIPQKPAVIYLGTLTTWVQRPVHPEDREMSTNIRNPWVICRLGLGLVLVPLSLEISLQFLSY